MDGWIDGRVEVNCVAMYCLQQSTIVSIDGNSLEKENRKNKCFYQVLPLHKERRKFMKMLTASLRNLASGANFITLFTL
jgi:hypothetical protein